MFKQLRLILLPFSFLYGLVILIRNKMYDWGIFKSTEYDIPVICVGNLAVGGSGKTPTTEYLVRLLSKYKVAILSRGYGRKTNGFILADNNATAESIGDEPLQYYQKFKNVTVAVSESRTVGVEKLKDNHDLIILDDAFQHRKVKAGFNILLFEYEKIKSMQFLLPAGNLRDIFSSRKRADVFIVTKSPENLSSEQVEHSISVLKPTNGQAVFHSHIKYKALKHIYSDIELNLDQVKGNSIYLLTGIANTKPLVIELEKYSNSIQHTAFPDHYAFKKEDIEGLKTKFLNEKQVNKLIITTEKDAKRLLSKEFKDLLLHLPIYYLPIEIDFNANDKQIFDHKILSYVESNRRNS